MSNEHTVISQETEEYKLDDFSNGVIEIWERNQHVRYTVPWHPPDQVFNVNRTLAYGFKFCNEDEIHWGKWQSIAVTQYHAHRYLVDRIEELEKAINGSNKKCIQYSIPPSPSEQFGDAFQNFLDVVIEELGILKVLDKMKALLDKVRRHG